MMIVIPYLVSVVTGFLVLQAIFKWQSPLNKILMLILSAGLGIGLTGTLTFYSLFFFNGVHPKGIAVMHLILLVVLVAIQFPPLIKNVKKISFTFNPLTLVAWLLWGIIFYVVVFMAKTHPFGEWDAWALYNMKMKFLIFSGEYWRDIFDRLHWYTQPDYPLLLPLINVFNFSLSQINHQLVPLITGVVFTMLITWLMFGGLKQIMPSFVAFIGSFLLLVNPFFIFQSSAQYADTLLAFYLLAAFICLELTLLYSDKRLCLIAGMMMGFMSFTKNEGLVMSLIFMLLFFFYILIRTMGKDHKKDVLLFIPVLIGGFVLTGASTMILKLFLAPANKDIFGGLSSIHMKFLNWKGFTMIVDALLYETTHKRWSFIWVFILFLLVVANKKIFYKECKIFVFFMLMYLSVLTVIYLTTVNFELAWRLKSTLHRICYYLLPTILYFCYYALWRTKYKEDLAA